MERFLNVINNTNNASGCGTCTTSLVDTGLRAESILPGSIKLHSKAAAIMRNPEHFG